MTSFNIIATWIIKLTGEAIWGKVRSIYEGFKKLGAIIGESVGEAVKRVSGVVSSVFSTIKEKIQSFYGWYTNKFGSIFTIFLIPFVLFHQGVKFVLNYIKDNFGPLISKILEINVIFEVIKGKLLIKV